MKKGVTAQDEFFDWAYDTRQITKRHNKIAWLLVFLFGVIALVEGFALLSLVPLKEKVPIIFTVDRNTGIIEQRTFVDALNWTQNEAEDYADVAAYVIAREGYLYATYLSQYESAVKTSTGVARADLVSNHAPDKLQSKLLKYKKHTQIDIRFKSLNYHGSNKNVVLARFITDIKTGSGVISKHYVATVEFEHASNESLSLTSRLSNPQGFVTTSYQVSEEGFQNDK